MPGRDLRRGPAPGAGADGPHPVGRRLFYVSYPFPPRVSGGTFRAVKFVKYLPEWFSGEIHVVTAPTVGWGGDPDLDEDIRGRCTVHPVPARFDPLRWKRRIRSARQNAPGGWVRRCAWRLLEHAYRPLYGVYQAVKDVLIFPDGKRFWSLSAIRFVRETLTPNPGDVLLTTCPERSLLVAARGLKRRVPEVRWVVDFRDGWFGAAFGYRTKNPLRRVVEGRLERKVFEEADAVVCATDHMERVYRDRYPWARAKLTTIFNGFDPADFEGLEPMPLEGDGVHVVYAGRAGGTHTTSYLLAAMKRLQSSAPTVADALTFHFVGYFADDPDPWVELLGDRFRRYGQRPHREALRFMLGADLLLLLLHPDHGGVSLYSGKIFEYLRAGNPILALSPPCGATQLIEEWSLGVVVPFDDVGAIAEELTRLVQQWRGGEVHKTRGEGVLPRFDRRETARQLARVIAPDEDLAPEGGLCSFVP